MTKTLKDLLEQAKDSRGVASGRALAELTAGREHKIDRTQVNAILKGTYKSELRPSTVRAIAWLAGVSEAVAFEAAGQPLPGPPFSEDLPPGTDYLTPQQRHAVVTVIRAFLGSASKEGGGEHEHGSAPIEVPAAGPADQPARQDFDLAALDADPKDGFAGQGDDD